MITLLQALYTYIQENRLMPYLSDTEYRETRRLADRHEDALRSHLPPEDAGKLDLLLENLQEAHTYEQEAMLRAALALGLELSQL